MDLGRLSDFDSRYIMSYVNDWTNPAIIEDIQREKNNKSSVCYQKNQWEKLKIDLYTKIISVNADNIGLVKEQLLCGLNLLRGKGLFCQFILQAQTAATHDSNVYATVVAAINRVFPIIGKLLLIRCIRTFETSYYPIFHRNRCYASVIFLAYLINHNVCHELLAIDLLKLLTDSPNKNTLDIAIFILEYCGEKIHGYDKEISEILSTMLKYFERFPCHDLKVSIRCVMKLFKNGPRYKHLDSVPVIYDQITHRINLNDSDLDPNYIADYFRHEGECYELNDKNYFMSVLESENWNSKHTLNSDNKYDSENKAVKVIKIIDKGAKTKLMFLKKMSRRQVIIGYTEFAQLLHNDYEIETRLMFLYCCSVKKTFEENFALKILSCQSNKVLSQLMVHSQHCVASNNVKIMKLRNAVKSFAYYLFTGSISWEILSAMHQNEDELTSYIRHFVKFLFQELLKQIKYNNLELCIQDIM